MDPFRDELAAAHAKIAELEHEIRTLKTHEPPRPADAHDQLGDRQRVALIVLVGGMALILLLAIIGGVVFLSRPLPSSMSSTPSAAFSGVAIEPTAQAPHAVSSSSPQLDKQAPYVVHKCNCQPGDPLCSCP